MKKLELSEIKQIELDILKNFAQFCDENHLCYTLAYGTLLGSVRHKGFIPWDDDIDVFMLRDDYNRLLSMKDIFERQFEDLCFKSLGDKSYPFAFLKITDNTTLVDEKEMESKYKYGIWIDVFPLDKVSKDEKKHSRNIRSIIFWNKILVKSIIRGRHIGSTWFQNTVNRFLLIPLAHCIKHFFNIPKICNSKSIKFNGEDTNLVANYVWENNIQKPVFDVHKLFPVKKECFEGMKFDIPNDSDYVLKNLYGDYMQLPPESERVSHLANAWRIR